MNRKRFLLGFLLCVSILVGCAELNTIHPVLESVLSHVQTFDKSGLAKNIGTILFKNRPEGKGIEINTNLAGLSPGEYQCYISENPSCTSMLSEFRSNNISSQTIMELPTITVEKDGTSKEILFTSQGSINNLKEHSIVLTPMDNTLNNLVSLEEKNIPIMICGPMSK